MEVSVPKKINAIRSSVSIELLLVTDRLTDTELMQLPTNQISPVLLSCRDGKYYDQRVISVCLCWCTEQWTYSASRGLVCGS